MLLLLHVLLFPFVSACTSRLTTPHSRERGGYELTARRIGATTVGIRVVYLVLSMVQVARYEIPVLLVRDTRHETAYIYLEREHGPSWACKVMACMA